MQNVTRTAYGSYLYNCLVTGLPFRVIENTTLNEKLNILKDLTRNLALGEYPRLRYFCIGNGGHKVIMQSGIPNIEPVQHHSTDASPFNMIPFVLREPDNDLPPGIREQYALRKIEEYSGDTYIAYYLKRIDYSVSKVEMNIRSVEDDGSVSVLPFIPNSSNLNPVPQDISPTGVNVIDGKYVDVSNQIELLFTPEDCLELRNVANVMYNNENLAIISEIGLVSGFDHRVNVAVPGIGNISINEVLAAQMCNILSTFESGVIHNLGFKVLMKLGSSIPLYITEPENP